MVRRDDRDRFVTVLFAPPDRREDLFALYAFNQEIARVREVVREPLLGLIRLQWWRDTLDQIYAGQTVAHPVANALRHAIERHRLPRASFDRLLDARGLDVEGTAIPDRVALESYLADTAGELTALAISVLTPPTPAADQAARQVGLAWGLTGILRAVAFHARQRRLLLPGDLLRQHGVDDEDIFGGRDGPGLQAVAQTLAGQASGLLAAARQARYQIPRPARAALLPARLADGYLAGLRAARYRLTADGWSAVRPRPLALLAVAAFGRY